MSSPSEARLSLCQRKLDHAVEELESYLQVVKETGQPRDYKDLMALYTGLLAQERRWALSSLYLSDALCAVSERLAEKQGSDPVAANELTALLKAV